MANRWWGWDAQGILGQMVKTPRTGHLHEILLRHKRKGWSPVPSQFSASSDTCLQQPKRRLYASRVKSKCRWTSAQTGSALSCWTGLEHNGKGRGHQRTRSGKGRGVAGERRDLEHRGIASCPTSPGTHTHAADRRGARARGEGWVSSPLLTAGASPVPGCRCGFGWVFT